MFPKGLMRRVLLLLIAFVCSLRSACLKTNGPYISTATPYTFDDIGWIYTNYTFLFTATSIRLCQVYSEGIPWFAGYQMTYTATNGTQVPMNYQGLNPTTVPATGFYTCQTKTITGTFSKVLIQFTNSSQTNTQGINYINFVSTDGTSYKIGSV
jgi:hypothetical protein